MTTLKFSSQNEQLLAAGIIRRSESPWTSKVLYTLQKDKWRTSYMCRLQTTEFKNHQRCRRFTFTSVHFSAKADVQEDNEPEQETRRSRRTKTKPSWLITSGDFVLQQHSGIVLEPKWRDTAEFLLEVSKDSFINWTRKREDS